MFLQVFKEDYFVKISSFLISYLKELNCERGFANAAAADNDEFVRWQIIVGGGRLLRQCHNGYGVEPFTSCEKAFTLLVYAIAC